MSQDPGEAPAATVELDELLLDAKLSVPPPRSGAVSRAALIEAARASECRVVGVTAPAGYGKSTLLAEWARGRGPSGRVGVARPLRRRSRGAADLVGVRVRPGLAGPRRPGRRHVGGLGVSVLGRAAPRLASAFRASPVPFVLMLDDLHELQSPACHDVLGVVISGIPPGSQLVAASRSEQPHLPRLRASGDALEFGRATWPWTRPAPSRSSPQRTSASRLSRPPR